MAVESFVNIHGRLLNQEEIVDILKSAPEVYNKRMSAYLGRMGRYFIGTKNKGRGKKKEAGHDGLIREQLVNKITSRGKPWESRIIRTMRYKVYDRKNLNMRMDAGLLYTKKTDAHSIMEMMESGATITSSKYMAVPVYQNLTKVHSFNKSASAIGEFRVRAKYNKFNMIFKNNKIYYVDKRTGLLLFVGQKTVKVKPQYKFFEPWHSAQSYILDNAEKAFDNATKEIEKYGKKGKPKRK